MGKFTANLTWALALAFSLSSPGQAASGKRVTITGELIDTWCYVSQIMGGSDFIVGSAHRTCALWCSAGGIPVGLLGQDGKIYMVLKFEDDEASVANPRMMAIADHTVTVDGTLHERDGIHYLMIDKVRNDQGIVDRTHESAGVIPPFAVPK